MERDVYNLARNILAGYDRRKARYNEMANAIYALSAPPAKLTANYGYSVGNRETHTAQSIADKILNLESRWNTRCMRAVEHAKVRLLIKHGDSESERIFQALTYNAIDSFRYTYPVLERTMKLYISRRTFFRIKEDFLKEISEFLDLN